MKNQVKFNVGDLVYIPSKSHKVHKLQETPPSHQLKGNPYPLCVIDDCQDIWRTFSSFGCYDRTADSIPELILATQQNYELLSKLYPNVTFEPPPKPKEPRDVIQAIINSNHKFIACINTSVDVEKHPLDGMGIFSTHTLKTIDYEKLIGELVPFDPKTGKTIIDFVNGEAVLENENG